MSIVKETAGSGLIGASARMNRLREEIAQAARHASASVLITGETGTGKELVARAIHAASARRGGPFVAVNCGAIAETLAESVLFGHVRGAFTGANEHHAGLLRSAQGGTVFLDEIGEATAAMQVRLLRVIEGRTVLAVGATRETALDVRFLAATNRDVREEMEAGRFRADLYYRVAGMEIRTPPLRERAEDVGELAEYFLERTGGGVRFTAGAVAALRMREWNGNVRELAHAVERLRFGCAGRVITEREVTVTLNESGVRSVSVAGAAREERRELVQRTLAATDWNVSATARALRTTRSTVRRYM